MSLQSSYVRNVASIDEVLMSPSLTLEHKLNE